MSVGYDDRVNRFGQPLRELCFTREDDERLAMGHPHLIELTDEALDPKKAQKLAAKAAYDVPVHHKTLRVRFPRAAAARFVRGARANEFQDWTRKAAPPDSAFSDASPITADEARELVRITMGVPGCTFNGNHRALYYVLEALVGTETVVDAILDGLEGLPTARVTHESGVPDRKTGGAAFILGFMFLRLEPRSRAARENRLRAFLDRAHALCAKAGSTSWELVPAIERVLDGWSAPSLTAGGYVYASGYVFATDDLDRRLWRARRPLRLFARPRDHRVARQAAPAQGSDHLDVRGSRDDSAPRCRDAVPRVRRKANGQRSPAPVVSRARGVGAPDLEKYARREREGDARRSRVMDIKIGAVRSYEDAPSCILAARGRDRRVRR